MMILESFIAFCFNITSLTVHYGAYKAFLVFESYNITFYRCSNCSFIKIQHTKFF